jgi:hypothetical protein
MNYFECCHHCVAPKRYPGCSGKCPEYAKARAKYDADQAKVRMERKVQSYTNTEICKKRLARAKYLKGNRRFTRA